MEQIISIGAQRTEGQLSNALGIEEGVGPGDFLLQLIDQAVGRCTGWSAGLMEQS
jgi:hypothetical protein